MNDKPSDSGLLLPNLSIENFRGIKKLAIPRLGRVTLLAGKNGVGKTTVLDAVKVYAGRAQYADLEELLRRREEFSVATDEESGNLAEPDWGALVYGRDTYQNARMSIGPTQVERQLRLETISLADLTDAEAASLREIFREYLLEDGMRTIRAAFQDYNWIIPELFFRGQRINTVVGGTRRRLIDRGIRFRLQESRLPSTTTCKVLGPELMSNFVIAQFWDNVALTDGESQATRALGLIYGADVERVAVVGDDAPSRRGGRRAIVKLKSYDRPVSLRSLGDGAVRLFGVALALANSRGGFLLIDEAENGIHYSVQRDFWRMVLRTAQESNVQVLATTHSWDCVVGFAQAAGEDENAEGVLVRLDREEDRLDAVEYSERKLRIAAEHGIEVR